MIYFDNAATTCVYKEVAKEIEKYSTEYYFNPSGLYKQAVFVKKEIENAKDEIKSLLGADRFSNVVFLSSATEANNLCLFGL